MVRRLYDYLARRAYTVIILAALFCTLTVKFFHAWRTELLNQYLGWILSDISFLLILEVILSLLCFRWHKKWLTRTVTIFAAIVCTWSVINAGWLIRTGTQVLPSVLMTVVRDPISAFSMIGVNLVKMPVAAFVLLGPSAVALAFFFSVLTKAPAPSYKNKFFRSRIIITLLIAVLAVLGRGAVATVRPSQMMSVSLRYNCQLRALTSMIFSDRPKPIEIKRTIPAYDEVTIAAAPESGLLNHNVVIVVLEGVQYQHTSLADPQNNTTPFMLDMAGKGVNFSNMRSTLTHTTKALFSQLTGRYASASHDIIEAVPAVKPYCSLATILRDKLAFRTAFFQSAKGSFEARPGLVHNLGFDKFWARDDLNDPNCHIGYLGCDEFAMLEPITDWIKSDKGPFLLTVLCSVTHDPYEVPRWFAEPAREPINRFRQAITYTDKFIETLDENLTALGLSDNTIFCVTGDHGEAFGEHGLHGHERIAFDEVLHVPWLIRAPGIIDPATKVTDPVSSIDMTPTILKLLSFDTTKAGFDGLDVLGDIAKERKVFFTGWMQQGSAGYMLKNRKFIYDYANKRGFYYDLNNDNTESDRTDLPEEKEIQITSQITKWRKNTIFGTARQTNGKTILYEKWQCKWNNRTAIAKYIQEKPN
jgi:arylsulfatase A-like enzyme